MEKDNVFQEDIQKLLQKTEKPIVLVGMMGAGKSHIGFALAQILDCPFYDVDKVIEEKAGMRIPDIFEKFGETKFREVESATITDLLTQPLCVIASGGGAFENEITRTAIKNAAHSVWLDVDIDQIWDRIKDSDRPLIQKTKPKETLKEILKKRRPQYEQADIHIKSAKSNAGEATQNIIKALSEI